MQLKWLNSHYIKENPEVEMFQNSLIKLLNKSSGPRFFLFFQPASCLGVSSSPCGHKMTSSSKYHITTQHFHTQDKGKGKYLCTLLVFFKDKESISWSFPIRFFIGQFCHTYHDWFKKQTSPHFSQIELGSIHSWVAY